MSEDQENIKLKQFLLNRAEMYKRVFSTEEGEEVLEDLMRFCRANTTTFHSNQKISDMLNGRRETFLRIQHHLEMSDDELISEYSKT